MTAALSFISHMWRQSQSVTPSSLILQQQVRTRPCWGFGSCVRVTCTSVPLVVVSAVRIAPKLVCCLLTSQQQVHSFPRTTDVGQGWDCANCTTACMLRIDQCALCPRPVGMWLRPVLRLRIADE